MKFLCLGYRDEEQWKAMDLSQQQALLKGFRGYLRELRYHGSFLEGDVLLSDSTAVSVQSQQGQLTVSEDSSSHEKLVFQFLLEARDLNHAINLAAKYKGRLISKMVIHQVLTVMDDCKDDLKD